ncbi:MAG: hypothetical protein LC754_08045 [Acidobacteria bacterium]|nr:hypothetical protein [Acidobacteriota bacterium]
MGILDLFRRKKADDEAARRAELLRRGRITDGSIFDIVTDEAGATTHIFYNYQINGVEYESSQLLDPEQQQRTTDYAPGASVVVRFNPRQPGNSVVV